MTLDGTKTASYIIKPREEIHFIRILSSPRARLESPDSVTLVTPSLSEFLDHFEKGIKQWNF